MIKHFYWNVVPVTVLSDTQFVEMYKLYDKPEVPRVLYMTNYGHLFALVAQSY